MDSRALTTFATTTMLPPRLWLVLLTAFRMDATLIIFCLRYALVKTFSFALVKGVTWASIPAKMMVKKVSFSIRRSPRIWALAGLVVLAVQALVLVLRSLDFKVLRNKLAEHTDSFVEFTFKVSDSKILNRILQLYTLMTVCSLRIPKRVNNVGEDAAVNGEDSDATEAAAIDGDDDDERFVYNDDDDCFVYVRGSVVPESQRRQRRQRRNR